METSKPKYSSQLITLLPILTIMVLMYGAAKQFIYYYNFNLDVFSFLDITELLPQTLFDLFIATFYIIIGFFAALYYSREVFKLKPRKVNLSNLSTSLVLPEQVINKKISELNTELSENQKKFRKTGKTIIIYFIGLITVHVYLLSTFYNELAFPPKTHPTLAPFLLTTDKILFNLFLISLITLLIAIPFAIVKNMGDRTLQVLISLTLFLTISGLFEGQFKYLKVISNHNHTNYSIIVNKEKKISNNDYYYIGKTKNFVFYYDVKSKLVTAYPMSLISELSIGIE